MLGRDGFPQVPAKVLLITKKLVDKRYNSGIIHFKLHRGFVNG